MLYLLAVSILVLMELCIKTARAVQVLERFRGFNPCFNGTMYKNYPEECDYSAHHIVSILVLMELCIKT